MGHYEIREEIYSSSRTKIYRGIDRRDQSRVIIKTPFDEFPSMRDVAFLKYEYQIAHRFQEEGIVRAVDLTTFGHRDAIVFEDFQGITLKEFLKETGPLELPDFLDLTIKIAASLERVHRRNIIHKDINPGNILLNRKTGNIQIIDFGISSELSREKQRIDSAGQLHGSLAYISPEQTGRVNRDLDYRSDYYSLGITFYEMLTGVLPFEAEGVIAWLHCHIAETPRSPSDCMASIPQTVSDIVMKLMSKSAEDRYQSSVGMIKDLEACRRMLRDNQDVRLPLLGQWDLSEKFQIPQKYYGREKELTVLHEAFRDASRGRMKYLLVSGSPGVGKSALVHELQRSIVQQRGYFIDGKYDQFKRDVPYSALAQAFGGLVDQLLTESDESLDLWKQRLLRAVYPNGRIIIDVIPRIETLIGEQEAVQNIGPREDQNRFMITFKKFIQVFARLGHPLVIFLDDLQWADFPTLKLLEFLVTSDDVDHLFLIGAYRDSEVSDGHPLRSSMDRMEEAFPVHHLFLQTLEQEHVHQMTAETLHCPLDQAVPLSTLLYAKTGGNPFFMAEMLKKLYKKGIFEYQRSEGRWYGDLETVSRMDVTDNVVDLMIGQLQTLPRETVEVIRTAACIGNSFDLKTLCLASGQSAARTGKWLLPVINEGIIVPVSGQYTLVPHQDREEQSLDFDVTYKFQHDRVQQAAHLLLGDSERKVLHLKIARLLLADTSEEDAEEKLVEIVRHFNESRDLLTEREERIRVSRLNWQASRKAKRSTAYAPSLQYALTAEQLLPPDAWTSCCYDLCFGIYRSCVEAAYLSGDLDTADEKIQVLLSHAKTMMEKAGIYRMQVLRHVFVGQLEEAILAGASGLALLGIKLSLRPGTYTVLKEMVLAKKNLGRRDILSLAEQDTIGDPEKDLALKILSELALPAYLLGYDNLFTAIVLMQINIALRFGNSPEAAYAYSTYAILLNAMGDLKKSYDFGKLSVRLNDTLNDLEYRCKINHVYGAFVHCWNNHMRTTIPYFEKAIEAGPQTGDLLYSGFAANSIPIWHPDLNLREAYEWGKRNLKIAVSSKYQASIDQGMVFQQYQRNLMGETPGPFSLSDDNFDEDLVMKRMMDQKNFNIVAMMLLVKLKLYYIYGEFTEGYKLISTADAYAKTFVGASFSMEYSFFTFMTMAAATSGLLSEKERSRCLKRMKKEYKQMRIWHNHYPVNSYHLVFLMEAESSRIAGKEEQGMDLLEKAAAAAEENGFMPYNGMAYELLAKLYLMREKRDIAHVYVKKAYYAYQIWGAQAKLRVMESLYPHFLTGELTREQSASSPHSFVQPLAVSLPAGTASVDLESVIKASQILAGEIHLGRLLEKMMRLVMENAGAERGLLLLPQNDRWYIEAEDDIRGEAVSLLQAIPLEESGRLAVGPVHYAIRTGQPLVLTDAGKSRDFSQDPYIAKREVKSLLCLPLMRQGSVSGVIYLENHLSEGTFTWERVELLKMLSSQMTISLENALLYQTMEERIQDRTRELKEAQTQLIQTSKLASIGELATGVAHELNQPLSYIRGEAQMELLTPPEEFDPDSARAAFRIIEKSSFRMEKIISHLREFAYPGENTLYSPLKIPDILDASLFLLQKQLDERDIAIRRELQESLQDIMGDAGRLEQVLINLFTNARDALQGTDSPEIVVKSYQEESMIVLSVSDNGSGIPEEIRPKIFDPFFTTKDVGEGTGLGLSISYGILRDHGGSIRLAEKPGPGTTMEILLPAAEGAD